MPQLAPSSPRIFYFEIMDESVIQCFDDMWSFFADNFYSKLYLECLEYIDFSIEQVYLSTE